MWGEENRDTTAAKDWQELNILSWENELKLAGKSILQYALLIQLYKSNVGEKKQWCILPEVGQNFEHLSVCLKSMADKGRKLPISKKQWHRITCKIQDLRRMFPKTHLQSVKEGLW